MIAQACRDCKTESATYHGNQVCERCYTERINGAGIFEDDDLDPASDDLFPEPPPVVARIVCVVCDMPATVAAGRICDLCRPIAAAHVAERHRAAVAALEEAWATWDAALAVAAPSDQARWARVEAARGAPRFDEAWAAAKAAGDTFAALLGVHEALQAVSDACNRVFEWAERARREL